MFLTIDSLIPKIVWKYKNNARITKAVLKNGSNNVGRHTLPDVMTNYKPTINSNGVLVQ